MYFTFSKNPFDKLSCWINNNIKPPLSRYYYKHKKAVYRCCVCRKIEAPYFTNENASITEDYGWHKVKGISWAWICHHCINYSYASSEDKRPIWERGHTWDEWQEKFVQLKNKELEELIKNKCPEFYHYEFENGWMDNCDWIERGEQEEK